MLNPGLPSTSLDRTSWMYPHTNELSSLFTVWSFVCSVCSKLFLLPDWSLICLIWILEPNSSHNCVSTCKILQERAAYTTALHTCVDRRRSVLWVCTFASIHTCRNFKNPTEFMVGSIFLHPIVQSQSFLWTSNWCINNFKSSNRKWQISWTQLFLWWRTCFCLILRGSA